MAFARRSITYRAGGASTVAMIGGDPRGVSAGIRLDAYRQWQGDAFDPVLFEPGDYGTESGRAGLERLLDRRPDIDAVFCASDRMAVGAMTAARACGRKVPDDLLVIGFDDQEFAAHTDPPLSTIRQRIPEVSRNAVGILLAALRGEHPADIVLPTELVARRST